MSIAITRVEDLDLTVFTAGKTLSYEDQLHALQDYFENEPSKFTLWDFRRVTTNSTTTYQTSRLLGYVDQMKERRPAEGRTAMVTKRIVGYGLARMSQEIIEVNGAPWQIRVFREIDAAISWLGLPYTPPVLQEETLPE